MDRIKSAIRRAWHAIANLFGTDPIEISAEFSVKSVKEPA